MIVDVAIACNPQTIVFRGFYHYLWQIYHYFSNKNEVIIAIL